MEQVIPVVKSAPVIKPLREKLLLFTLAATQFINIVDFMIMMPLGPRMMREMKIDLTQFGLMVSAYSFSAGISGFLAAFWLDRFDRKTAMQILFTGFLIGTFACGYANNYILLTAARIFTGAFAGVMGALVISIIGDAIPYERRGTAMGILMTSFSAASALGIPMGLRLANKFDMWQAPFLVLAGMGVLVWVFISISLPSLRGHIVAKDERNNPFEILRIISKDGNQLRALATTGLMFFGQFTIIPFLSAYIVKNAGYPELDLEYVYISGGIATIIFGPLIGKLADKIGKPKVFIASSILAAIFGGIYTNLGLTPMYVVIILNSLYMIVGSGRGISSMTMITGTVKPQHRGGFMSINTCVQNLSCASGAYIGGLVVYTNDAGKIVNYNLVGYITVACCLLALYFGYRLRVVK
ncbi:MAG: MFS transporter [Bacteroidota bacterium]